MHSCISDVADFRTACRLPIAREPDTLPETARLNLMTRLISEEADEINDAADKLWHARLSSIETQREALASLGRELVDVIYNAVGAALELGIPLAAVWAEVHRSNMAKVRPPIRVREDGKILKPENWTPPDVLGAVFGKGAK